MSHLTVRAAKRTIRPTSTARWRMKTHRRDCASASRDTRCRADRGRADSTHGVLCGGDPVVNGAQTFYCERSGIDNPRAGHVHMLADNERGIAVIQSLLDSAPYLCVRTQPIFACWLTASSGGAARTSGHERRSRVEGLGRISSPRPMCTRLRQPPARRGPCARRSSRPSRRAGTCSNAASGDVAER